MEGKMSKSAEFIKYKKHYDEINEKIKKLCSEQAKVLKLMQEHCPHSNLILIDDHDPLEIALGIVDEDEIQYKCQDCFKYFDLKKAKELNLI